MKKYYKRNKKDIIRSLIVLIAAILVALLAVTISEIMEKPIKAYYPHDESRGTNAIKWKDNIENVFICQP